jgi:hypothetical protein
MKAARVVSAIVLPVLLVMAILAVSVYAGKPPSPPGRSKQKPVLVSVAGAIVGIGAPTSIAIELSDTFQGTDVYGEYRDESGSFISNPDYPPSLRVSGPRKNKRLSYYYCDSTTPEHTTTEDGICNDESHDPENYKRLLILGGTVEKETGDIVFPAGSAWRIGWKDIMGTLIEGTIDEEVRYAVEE